MNAMPHSIANGNSVEAKEEVFLEGLSVVYGLFKECPWASWLFGEGTQRTGKEDDIPTLPVCFTFQPTLRLSGELSGGCVMERIFFFHFSREASWHTLFQTSRTLPDSK